MTFSVVLSDPPWVYQTYSAKGQTKSPKYSVMTIKDLIDCGPMIKDLVGKHSVHCMWATIPHLENALAVMASWGYEYKSARVWYKSHRGGTGHWALCNAELLLIGTRGKVALPTGKPRRTVFEGKPAAPLHSSKPLEVHNWLEAGYPTHRKMELFARRTRPQWETYGNELGSLITPEGIIACALQRDSSRPSRKSTRSSEPKASLQL